MHRSHPTRAFFLLFLFLAISLILGELLRQTAIYAAYVPQAIQPDYSGLVINEIHADPATSIAGDANGDGIRHQTQDEFIEIVNNSGSNLDLSGWTLADIVTIRHTFPAGTIIPNQCAIIVFGGGTPTGSFGNAEIQLANTGQLGLNNTGETITLTLPLSTTTPISITYGNEANNDQSLTREPDISGTWVQHSNAAASNGALFSPGTQLDGTPFSGCTPPGDAAPNITSHIPADGATAVPLTTTVAITFSEPVTLTTSASDLTCNISGNHAINIGGGPQQFEFVYTPTLSAGETCTVTVLAAKVHDIDDNDPPDQMAEDVSFSFVTAVPPATQMIINEVDADTTGVDTEEFIELFDSGVGNSILTGLSLVLYNGSTDSVYYSIDLDGYTTNASGYFVLGNTAVPNVDLVIPDSSMQNGADAVALYVGNASEFPNGTAVTTTNLLDAFVYGTDDPDDLELLTLLNPNQPQVNENGRGAVDSHANQRCPNGEGGQRNTAGYLQNNPTPGMINNCIIDDLPTVSSTIPTDGTIDVPVESGLSISFNEEVSVSGEWFSLTCGSQTLNVSDTAVTGGPTTWQIKPNNHLPNGHSCNMTVFATQVIDLDGLPDNLAADFNWQFSTITLPPATNMLINEVDADTPGVDTAEFIELYDGGSGNTALGGLVVVLFNGSTDTAYHAIDLDGHLTDVDGYFVLGSTAVPNVDLVIPESSMQNGADAVALYVSNASDFPNGTAVTVTNLLDAFVYGTDDPDDLELLTLLNPNQPQVNENGRGAMDSHANQRCPNGEGGQRNTAGYLQNNPTPGMINNCIIDDLPTVSSTIPTDGTGDVPIESALSITFSEEVSVSGEWFSLTCGSQTLNVNDTAVTGGPTTWGITPNNPLPNGQDCTTTIFAAQVSDLDGLPDNLAADFNWQFNTIALPPATNMLINEVDADTPGVDTAEFIELFDGGSGNTALDGLIIVLFNGGTDTTYRAIDLDGQATNANGYFVLGSTTVTNVDFVLSDSSLQNGADAVALYVGNASDFPNGTAVTTTNLLDAFVYDTDDSDDPELLTLLNSNQPQVNENGRGAVDSHANQRCPNGAGGQRNTAGYLQNDPTPGMINNCIIDDLPTVSSTIPTDGTIDVPVESALSITFSEAVSVSGEWFSLTCGSQTLNVSDTAVTGGPTTWQITPDNPLPNGQDCTVTIFAAQVTDLDGTPDPLPSDTSWQFSTVALPPPTHLLINEVDADTPGSDKAEFIELYDGGSGNTTLSGLVVVFFNGSNDTSYKAVDLDNWATNTQGYFVLGSEAVANVDLIIPNNSLQNGADAIALYVGNATDFPNGTAVTTNNLLDALVYDTNDGDDSGLLPLLNPGQPQVNENGANNKNEHANQRCPNGGGDQRDTDGYKQNPPTPGDINDCTTDNPPMVSSTTPPDGAVGVFPDVDLIIEFSEDVTAVTPWVTVTCSASGTQATAVAGGPQIYVISLAGSLLPGELCTATIPQSQISDQDGLPTPMVADFSWQFTIGIPAFGACGDPATPIHTIQGNSMDSPLNGQQGVIIEGIVVAEFLGTNALQGFFVQEDSANWDDDPQTSEGIFVYDKDNNITLTKGELIRLQGDVTEHQGLTELSNIYQVASCNKTVNAAPTIVTLPVADLAEWEQYEGMLITIMQTLAVTGHHDLGQDGQVDLALNERLMAPTAVVTPGSAANDQQSLNDRRRILLDDGRSQTFPAPLPPYLANDNTLRAGDTLDNLTGVLTFSAHEYRIHPTQPVEFVRTNGRSSTPPSTNGRLQIASLDLHNYFNGDGQGGGFPTTRGAATPEEFVRQRAKLINALVALQADIIGLTELENDGYGSTSAIQDLVNGLNNATPEGTSYAFVDPQLRQLGTDEIAVGLLYRIESVALVDTAVTTDTAPFDTHNRQPLAQTFTELASGETFTVVVNHFKSKSTCPNEGENSDQGDGQGCWNAARTAAATAVATWLNSSPTGSSDPDTLLLGNLNAYAMEDPLGALNKIGYTSLITLDSGMNAYTSIANGQSGVLDYALTNESLKTQVSGATIWHINADEPRALDYRADNQPPLYQADPFRAAEHDPLLIGLNLSSMPPQLIYTPIFFFEK